MYVWNFCAMFSISKARHIIEDFLSRPKWITRRLRSTTATTTARKTVKRVKREKEKEKSTLNWIMSPKSNICTALEEGIEGTLKRRFDALNGCMDDEDAHHNLLIILSMSTATSASNSIRHSKSVKKCIWFWQGTIFKIRTSMCIY